MNNELINYLEAEIGRLRALDGPCARFVANQLDRTLALLRLTGANSESEFDARVECNEDWVKENAYERGYAEGRASMCFEVGSRFHLPN
jgi:hypothetical protein